MKQHLHSVYDTDLHFTIDPITRKITNGSKKVTLMQYDHDSERFTFELPRYIEGHDMLLCDVVEVHYINTDAKSKRKFNSDVYIVTDFQVSPESDDVAIGSWLISKNATEFAGSLHFTLRFACTTLQDEVAYVTYQWFTDIYTAIVITEGIYNEETVVDTDDPDILRTWKQQILAECMPHVVEAAEEAKKTLAETNKLISTTEFIPNLETGDLEYNSTNFNFKVNYETGNLEWEVAI